MQQSKPYLIVGDIHNKVEKAESIMRAFDATHTIVQVGDVFDAFHDTPEDAQYTAEWLKHSITKTNRIHLLGNHDLPYHPCSTAGALMYDCPGYSKEKHAAVKKVMAFKDWEHLHIYHVAHGWLVTHAGLHPRFLYDTKNPLEKALVALRRTTERFENRLWDYLLGGIGMARCGHDQTGGVVWLDHFEEAKAIEGLNQVYGHSPTQNAHILYAETTQNVNIDTYLQEVLEIQPDGKAQLLSVASNDYRITASPISNKVILAPNQLVAA